LTGTLLRRLPRHRPYMSFRAIHQKSLRCPYDIIATTIELAACSAYEPPALAAAIDMEKPLGPSAESRSSKYVATA
jgi:hypothetical protein